MREYGQLDIRADLHQVLQREAAAVLQLPHVNDGAGAEDIKSNYDEEACSRNNIWLQRKKAEADGDKWRRKYETGR